MKRNLHLLFLLSPLVLVLSCASPLRQASLSPFSAGGEHTHSHDFGVEGRWADSVLATLTLEEKVGQILMARGFGHYISTESDEYRRLTRMVLEEKLGGLIIFQGDVYEEAILLNRMQRLAKVPLLVSGDFERGLAMRVRRGTYFPDAMAIGATRNAEHAYRIGQAIAKEGRALGVHQTYAPVADINDNPDNPVINTRSFGSDRDLVATMVAAFTRGTNDGGMISTAKHFPGHGNTAIDSHLELPTLALSRVRLDTMELVPFRAAIDNGVMSMMIAHIAVPALDSIPGIPATLSRPIVTDVLRGELGFRGLVVTDAMDMQGVTRGFSIGEGVVMAFQAGADIVLMPADVQIAVNALLGAVKSGEISEARLTASVRKVLDVKEKIGLHKNRCVEIESIADQVASREHQKLARTVARDAITVLSNDNAALPIKQDDRRKIVSVVINDTEDNLAVINRSSNPWPMEPVGAYFHSQFRNRYASLQAFRVGPSTNQLDFDSVLAAVGRADMVVLPLYVKVRTSSGKIGLPSNMDGFLQKLQALRKPMVVVSFGNPYILGAFPTAQALVSAYADAEVLVDATVEALFGEIPVRGKLPVTISERFSFGSGLELNQSSLRIEEPAVAGFEESRLAAIDELITAAIRDSAFPAAQVAIVKDNLIVYNKSFGTYTYDRHSREISPRSMFDLASLTKVIATTSAVMKLVDQRRLSLDDPVGKYLPQFAAGPKAAITIRHLLTHTSGLAPFLKLYDVAKTPEAALDTIYASRLVATPGDTMIYSDLGMITEAKLVEKITGMPLDVFVRQEFFEPLGLRQTMFNPPQSLWREVAPTEIDTVWRMRLVQGTVHDERSALLGGVAGHAGLFSTASDLAIFMQMLMNGGTYGGTRYLSDTSIALFTRRQGTTSTRALGWDTKSATGSSAGNRFSASSFGHTGFTGTSIWVDPDRKLCVIFLTNRVYPTRTNSKLFRIRPMLHDAVVRALVQSDSKSINKVER